MKKVILFAMIFSSLVVRGQAPATNSVARAPSVPALSQEDPAWNESESELWQWLAVEHTT